MASRVSRSMCHRLVCARSAEVARNGRPNSSAANNSVEILRMCNILLPLTLPAGADPRLVTAGAVASRIQPFRSDAGAEIFRATIELSPTGNVVRWLGLSGSRRRLINTRSERRMAAPRGGAIRLILADQRVMAEAATDSPKAVKIDTRRAVSAMAVAGALLCSSV